MSIRFIIIGSDGLWDCLSPSVACSCVLQSLLADECDAAEALVDKALTMMPNCGVADNCSAIVIFL
jgi:serine/threonine protein phosphatase PrpC